MLGWGEALIGWVQINLTVVGLVLVVFGVWGFAEMLDTVVRQWWSARRAGQSAEVGGEQSRGGTARGGQRRNRDGERGPTKEPASPQGVSDAAPASDPIEGYCPDVSPHHITYDEAGHCWRCCGQRFPTLVMVEQHAGKATGRAYANRWERLELTALTDDPDVALELLQQHVRKAIP